MYRDSLGIDLISPPTKTSPENLGGHTSLHTVSLGSPYLDIIRLSLVLSVSLRTLFGPIYPEFGVLSASQSAMITVGQILET